MPREFSRTQRLAEQMRRAISELLRRELQDPRIGFVTITEVNVSRDLSHAKVYFSVLEPARDLAATQQALDSAAGYLRGLLGKEMVIRNVPQLRFVYDDSMEVGAKMDSLIADAVARDRSGHGEPE